MFPVISLGPISFPAPGLLLLIGIWVGLTVAERLAPRYNANPHQLNNLIFVVLVAGVIGARLSYALQNLEAFAQSPLSLFSLNPGSLDPIGGAAVAVISGIVFASRKQLPLWTTLDALTPFFAIIWVAMGLSNLASGKAFGIETQMPWGIYLWGALRHPTQIYQVVAGGVILGLIWPRTSGRNVFIAPPGGTFALFLGSSSVAWLIIEAFRGDSTLLPGGVRLAQVFAWIGLAISLWLVRKLQKDHHVD
jgi:phosphatidylglycerol:prolipoprotein diacylglycerol transferase